MNLFKHTYETPKQLREVPGTGTRSDLRIFQKERAKSLEATREAMAEYQKEKAQGAVALEGAEVMPVTGQLDPSHEITAHAQQQDVARTIAEADAADKVASGHLTTV